ncbi:MAG: hypothetical protein J1E41_04405, partial [Ruminococcus sp.]|nr:hypothetical protein [Ruminococcus sp.]
MRNFKKIIAVMLSALILASCLSISVFAADSANQTDTLKVNISSNITPTTDAVYNTKLDNTFTVSFKLQSNLKIVNTQGSLKYDKNFVQLVSFELLGVSNTMVNTEILNEVAFNSTDINNPADFKATKDLVKATFKILSTGTTYINLKLDEINSTSGDASQAD